MRLRTSILVKKLKQFALVSLAICFTMLVSARPLWAQEITAIDFNGDLIGKVIPDGKVVGFDNQLIGNVTADSLILNFDGALIGGVVPQGVAIGNDNKLLGKVSNDGSVRLASGKIIGKVLPNGLVINDYFEIIGAVLFPGLVYSDEGKTVGRLTGDGYYTNLKGQAIGFMTPDGYAYRKVGTDFVLDGRLISSKMVVSLDGEFIGSVVPGGSVSNFDAEIIGKIKANGFVYNDANQVIGKIVRSGYAFDNNGFYLGFVTYNGEVVDNEKLVGRMRADGNIVDEDNNIIGYSVDIAATATDFRGKYIGRIMPEGNIAKGKDTIALMSARGVIVGADGSAIGQLIKNGPVFDYKGSLKAHALSSGSVIDVRGTPLGYSIADQAFDFSGRVLGAVMPDNIVLSNQNEIVGLTGINGQIIANDDHYYVSPYGYVFNAEGEIVGSSLPVSPLYNQNGNVSARIGLNGGALGAGSQNIGNLTGSGMAVDTQNKIVGRTLGASYAVDSNGKLLGHLSEENLILDNNLAVIGKILPDYSVVAVKEADTPNLVPQIGDAFAQQLVNGFNGNLLGYANINGIIKDFSGANIGRVVARGYAVDNNNIVIGHVQDYSTVINNSCELQGVITPKGDVQNFREIHIGKALYNGQVLSDANSILGYVIPRAALIDYSGETIGTIGFDGRVINYNREDLGCINARGQLKTSDNLLIAKVAEYAPVIDFSGKIIGRSVLSGAVINNNGAVSGYQQPDGNVNSTDGLPLGNLFKFTVAFDNDNKFLGRVLEDGSVVNDRLENVGSVDFDGFVVNKKSRVGYALYDFYVYDNNYNAIGYIVRSGDVLSFANQNLGRIDRGFLLDAERKVIARGNRDFYIRDNAKNIIGELNLNGDVVDIYGTIIGTLSAAGEIRNAANTVLANATPLQYYNQVSSVDKRLKMIFDENGRLLGYLDENSDLVDKDGNIIGTTNENGELVDKDGNVLKKMPENAPVYDKAGNVIGYADAEGKVKDLNGKVIGQLDENGNLLDANGNIIGGIGANWYEKAPEKPLDNKKEDKTTPVIGLLEDSKYRKSLGVALTPDGEYLGDIMEDGSVVDENGDVIGHRMPDGLIIDDDGNLIGTEENRKVGADERGDGKGPGGIFVPPGTFGPGGAYGTGTGVTGNLGPGGGYGPGERYDPMRAAALNAAMSERRKNISVGKISNGMRKEAFDGMQKDWSEQGISKVISSWRVDMSEMIFADKPIPAVISRAIDSNNPAPITAFVERNVYAEEGRNVIIPAGSRLVGTLGGVTASTEATSESARVQISWERLIRPDGSLFVFQGLTADAQGRAGALGYVDQQLFKKYTLPVMTSTLTSATAYVMAPNQEAKDNETPKQQAANDARENFLNQMNQVFDEILADKSNIKPMTYIPAGTRIIVFPNADLWLRTVERDQDSSAMLEKPTILIDDKKAVAEREGRKNEDIRKNSTPVNSDVVYEEDDAGVESSKSMPLVESPKKKKTPAPGAATYVAPPPPPSAPTYNKSSGSSNSTTDNSVPALF